MNILSQFNLLTYYIYQTSQMRKFQQNLSNFKRGDFFTVCRKIVVNELIQNKDFSGFYFRHVKFFNCSFRNVSFTASECYSLIFCNCQFNKISFSKADFINITFQNCQLMNCSFGGLECDSVRYVNCQLNSVNFNAADLTDFEFEKSQLFNVSFGGSEVDNLIIKNSTLKDIRFNRMSVYKTVSKNGILTTEEIPIQDYASFFTEFVK